jgi:hypothetical protein
VNIIFSPVQFLGQEGLQDSDPLEESKLTKEPTRTEFNCDVGVETFSWLILETSK